MAGQKQHDYHIVDPSPWPALGALGAFTMLTGAVFWIREIMAPVGPYVFGVGILIILYTMYVWWSDVNKEAHHGDHTPVVQIGLRYGIALFIISEIMFFVAWFWMYFKHAIFPMQSEEFYPDGGVWPPEGVDIVDPWGLPLLNTLILLTSGATVTWAHHALLENDRRGFIQGLALTVILGAIFTAVQGYEYYEIIHLGWFDSSSLYFSVFFLATGFHGFHVIIGTIYLMVCLVMAMRGEFDPANHIGFEGAAWYWHFVDVVWLFLFAGIYVGAVTGL